MLNDLVKKAASVSGDGARELYEKAMASLEAIYGSGNVWSRAADNELDALESIERMIGKSSPSATHLDIGNSFGSGLKQTAKTDDGRRFFRFYDSEDPMSDFGHAMFREASNPYEAQDMIGHYGKNAFELDTSSGKYPYVHNIERDIMRAIAKENRRGMLPEDIEQQLYDGVKIREILNGFNPEDIVDSAAGYDNPDYLSFIYDHVIEPNGYRGVKTSDGAISFYPEDINHFARKSGGRLPGGLKSVAPLAAAGGLMAAMSPSESAAAQRIRSLDSPIEEAWNPVEAFAGGLGGGVRSALAGVLPDGAMDWAINRIGGLMSGGK